jgi:hypothetical protein
VHEEAFKTGGLPTEPAPEPEKPTWFGCKIKVGDKDVYVHQLGRWIGKDRAPNVWASGRFSMSIFDEKGANLLRRGTLNSRRLIEFPSDQFGYEYASMTAWQASKVKPLRLKAGATYFLVSSESGGKKSPERFYGPTAVEVLPAAGITVEAAVSGADGKKWEEKAGSLTYGPLNLRVSTEIPKTDKGMVGIPMDYSEYVAFHSWMVEEGEDGQAHQKKFKPIFDFGTKCAFLQGESSMTREFEVEKEGKYWFTFNCGAEGMATGRAGQGTVRVLIDGKDASTRLLPSSGYGASPYVMHFSSSNVVHLKPGRHTVTFERVNPGESTVFIDTVHLSNELAFYGGREAVNFPAGGGAIGQDSDKDYGHIAMREGQMARNWGLVPMTYEGGWAVQRDFDRYSMNAWNDLRYGNEVTDRSLTAQALRNAFHVWCREGGYMYAYFYPVMRDIDHVDAPLYKAVQALNDELTPAPVPGTKLPGTLTAEGQHVTGQRSRDKNEIPARSWRSWCVYTLETTEYTITIKGSGGDCGLVVDGETVARGKAEGLSAKVTLTAGAHSIRVDAEDQPLNLDSVVVERREE